MSIIEDRMPNTETTHAQGTFKAIDYLGEEPDVKSKRYEDALAWFQQVSGHASTRSRQAGHRNRKGHSRARHLGARRYDNRIQVADLKIKPST